MENDEKENSQNLHNLEELTTFIYYYFILIISKYILNLFINSKIVSKVLTVSKLNLIHLTI